MSPLALPLPVEQASKDAAGLVVLKFGSSVLRTADDLPEVVSEIYRAVRSGQRVIAIVSAFAGITNRLLGEAHQYGATHDTIAAPPYIALGEETTAALLGLACDRAGLATVVLKTADLGIIASGDPMNAIPHALHAETIIRAFEHHDVVIGPGFTATSTLGRTMLLGRGGSDLTAVFIGRVLGAERVRLLKDVDGVYEADPALSQKARRFARIDWSHASAVAGALVQPKALAFAAENELTVEVGALGARDATIIAAADGIPALPRRPRKLRVALAGLGTVGAGVAQRIMRQQNHFEIAGALVRDPNKVRDCDFPGAFICTDPADLLAAKPDIIIDMLSSGEVGAELSEQALQRGIHVVSANKQAIAARYHALKRAAANAGSRLAFSAAVGGAAPLLECVGRARRLAEDGAPIYRIEAVLNGTVNFVLERLAAGETLPVALAAARAAGLAEEDASVDLNGGDALAKLKLIALQAFDTPLALEELHVEPLDAACAQRARGVRLKQIARLTHNNARLRGEIVFEPAANGTFNELTSDHNAICISSRNGVQLYAQGRGAGRWPTTESVFADLIDLHNLLSG